MIRLFKIFYALLLVAAFVACSDDTIMDLSRPGQIEKDGDERVTVLHLSSEGCGSWNTANDVVFDLVDPVNRNSFSFRGNVIRNPEISVLGKEGAATCRIVIGLTDIPDGAYYLTVKGFPELASRLVRFTGNIGAEEADNPYDYEDLSGSGTSQDPYLINDAGDFLSLLYYLQEDPKHACGRYFRQTASFELPHRSMIIDGHIWLPVTFSGHYDGGGFELRSLAYQGASDINVDTGIGLFKDLYSASVEHVKFANALIMYAHSNVGLVAGSSSGNTSLNDITLNGTVMACGDKIGGLIGSNEGNLTISDIKINSLSVNGSDSEGQYVGGLVGASSVGSLSVSGVSTPDHVFSVMGHRCVGGVAGCVSTQSPVTFSGITLEHTVDKESSDVKVIYGSDMYIGGLSGYFDRVKSLKLENISIKCPVRGKQDVGGISGHAIFTGPATIENTVLSSVVSGDRTVGGFFGYFNPSNSDCSLRFTGADNTTRYVVKSSAKADVEGDTYVGGIVGYLEGNNGGFVFDSKVEIAINVSGKSEVGGAVGHMRSGLLDITNLNFSSSTMNVLGTENVGGVIGLAISSIVKGPDALDLYKEIPTADKLHSCFGGVVKGNKNIGGVAGSFTGTMSGVGSSASVTSTVDNAGGICGYFDGTISSCSFFGSVSCPGYVAGICAQSLNPIHIDECLNLADISGGEWQAGVVACVKDTNGRYQIKVERCYNRGNLTDGKGVGGIVGYVYKAKTQSPSSAVHVEIYNCGNSGEINSKGDSNHQVGGIAGFILSDFVWFGYCANHGHVTSKTVQRVIAGVAGELGYDSDYNWITVYNCMNSGTISTSGFDVHIGGVVGHIHSGNLSNSGIVRDCYNTGNIPPDVHDDTGGILGYATYHTDTYRTFNRGVIGDGNAIIGTHKSGSLFYHSDNYFLEDTGGDWPSSKSVSKKDLGNKSVYKNFDFDNVWQITSDGPVLRNCPFQFVY